MFKLLSDSPPPDTPAEWARPKHPVRPVRRGGHAEVGVAADFAGESPAAVSAATSRGWQRVTRERHGLATLRHGNRMSMDDLDIRRQLLVGARCFVRCAAGVRGVRRIELIGSIVTDKADPKDIDVLVTVEATADLKPLAQCARRLQGSAQGINRGADVFLVDVRGHYLGRTCPWKDCRPGVRSSCDALHCGRRPYLHDDLATLRLSDEVVASAAAQLWPVVERRHQLPGMWRDSSFNSTSR